MRPTLLARCFSWERPHQAWVGDITYVWTAAGWVYLAILVDLYTRAIVGYATGTECNTELALAALDGAVARYRPWVDLLQNPFGETRRDGAGVDLYGCSRWLEKSGTSGSSESSDGVTAG